MHWFARRKGDPSKQALVFFHGWLGSSFDWESVSEFFVDDFCCYLIDLPGHGQALLSNEELKIALSFDEIISSLVDFLRNGLSLERASVVGYSMGGRLAMALAERDPTYIDNLVLENCHPGLKESAERSARIELDSLRAQRLLELGMVEFLDSWYQAKFFQSLHNHPLRFAKMFNTRSQNLPSQVVWMLRHFSTGKQANLWPKLSSFTFPCLLLTGDLDLKYVRLMREIEQLLPSAKLYSHSEAGHNVHFEFPSDWVCSVQTFLLTS